MLYSCSANVLNSIYVMNNTQRYRSGHNGADSKSVCANAHEGSNPSLCANKKEHPQGVLFFIGIDGQDRTLHRKVRGFAFERKPSVSWFTSGEAKNLRQRRIPLQRTLLVGVLLFLEQSVRIEHCTSRCEGSHTASEDRRVYSSGEGSGYLRKANIPPQEHSSRVSF